MDAGTLVMDAFSKVAPFVWPYRRLVALSVLCAVVISILWAGNLSATLPVVRVLFEKEDRNLQSYVDDQIALMQQEINDRAQNLDAISEDDLLARGKALRDQSIASQRLAALTTARDYVLPWVPRDRFNTIAMILGALLVATFLKGIFIYLQEVLVGSVVNRSVIDIRKKCFRHVLSLDLQTINQVGVPNLMSRLTNDVEVLASGLRTFLVRLIREPMKAGGCILFAFVLNWRLTLLSLLVVPLIGLVFHRFGKSLKRASHGTMESMSGIYTCLSETLDSMKVVIAFGAGRRHRGQFRSTNREYYTKSMKVVRVSAMTRPTTEIMGVVAVLCAVLPGTYLVLRQTDSLWGIQLAAAPMDMAELSALYALLAGTLDSIRKLSSVYGELKRASAASDRLFEILETKTLVPEPEIPRVACRLANHIEFQNVSFHYRTVTADGRPRPPALKNVDLKVKAGEVVAVIGENGSGKSTLINLLPRFADPDQGAVLIDGVNVLEMRSRDLRSQIGLVTQETLLFDDTIFENIRYGNPTASRSEIEAAARQAHVTSFISQLPEGFETRIGVKGQKLSGGQRQRVALARAILRDPAILILDEATSAIDSQSEHLIHRVLKDFTKDRTVFIITHVINDTFLDLVTRVVVLDAGQIAASGTHAELLADCDIYQRLYHASSQKRAA